MRYIFHTNRTAIFAVGPALGNLLDRRHGNGLAAFHIGSQGQSGRGGGILEIGQGFRFAFVVDELDGTLVHHQSHIGVVGDKLIQLLGKIGAGLETEFAVFIF